MTSLTQSGMAAGLLAGIGRASKYASASALMLFILPPLMPAAMAQTAAGCVRGPSANYAEMPEAEARAHFLRYWEYQACLQKKVSGNLHKYPGHDALVENLTATFDTNIKRIKERKRIPTVAYARKALGEHFAASTQLDLINYFSVSSSIGSLERDPYRRGRDLYAGLPHFSHRGGNPKANAERVARDVRIKPVPPWFIIGNVEIIDSEIERRFREAERRYSDAQHVIDFEREDLKQAEAALSQETKAFVDFERTERERVATEVQRLTQEKGGVVFKPDGTPDIDIELVLRDSKRRKQVARDRLERVKTPFERVARKIAAAERERDAAMDDMARIRPLLKVQVRAIRSLDYAAEWESLQAHDDSIEELAKARDELSKKRFELDETIAIRDDAFAKLRDEYTKLNTAAELARERSGNSVGIQFALIALHRGFETFRGGGGLGSTAIRLLTQVDSDLVDPPKIVESYAFDWTALNQKNLADAQSEIADGGNARLRDEFGRERLEDAIKTGPERVGKYVADKNTARHLERSGAARDELKKLRNKIDNYEMNRGIKNFAGQAGKDTFFDMVLAATLDGAKIAVAKLIEAPAIQNYVSAYVRAGAYARLYHEAAIAVEAARQMIDEQEAAVKEKVARLKSSPSLHFKPTRNDPFFAEENYRFDLTFTPEGAAAAARAAIKVALLPEAGEGQVQGSVPAIELRPMTGSNRTFYVLPERSVDRLKEIDVEKLALSIVITPAR